MYSVSNDNDIYYEIIDKMRKGILEDLSECSVKYNGVERTVNVLVAYEGGSRKIVELDGGWAIVDKDEVIAVLKPVDLLALNDIGQVIPAYNSKLNLYKKIKGEIKSGMKKQE